VVEVVEKHMELEVVQVAIDHLSQVAQNYFYNQDQTQLQLVLVVQVDLLMLVFLEMNLKSDIFKQQVEEVEDQLLVILQDNLEVQVEEVVMLHRGLLVQEILLQ